MGVCGCYAQVQPQAVRELDVDVISGSAGREAFLGMMLLAAKERTRLEQVDQALQRRTFEILPAGGLEARTRAMLKVQDGCNNFCSYCIIPYARGPVRSEPLEAAVAQARELAAAGYREIVVTGIEIASWGWDLKNGQSLTDLLEALCAAVPDVRIRLGSLEPRIITQEFCQRLSPFSNLCPQFHLSLQAGSDAVLHRMRRKYDTARYAQSVALLREWFPGCALTTDLIVGFPGETEAELEESLAFARQCGFAAMHIFPYSRRPRHTGRPDAGATVQGGKGGPQRSGHCRCGVPGAGLPGRTNRDRTGGSLGRTGRRRPLYRSYPQLHQGLCTRRRPAQPNLPSYHPGAAQRRPAGAVQQSADN